MEGAREVINAEGKIVNELKGELAEAYKTIAEKEAEMQRLQEKNAVLEKRHLQTEGGADASGAEVKPSPMMERKAEEIIPKECWGIVFQKLNVEDLLSCRQVCKTFKQLLELKEFKEKWKFHLVLPLLFPYLTKNDWNPYNKWDWKHLYNARLVCRTWRHSIDTYASEMHGTHGFLPSRAEMQLQTCFQTSEDIEEFQQRFGVCKTNPFPSRSVFILKSDEESTDEDEDDSDYYDDYFGDAHCNARKQFHDPYIEKVFELLEQFGKHIYRLQWWFQYKEKCGPDPLTLCKLIKRVTIHFPNLKELELFEQLKYNNEKEDEDDVKDVATYIEENALAALPKLQTLSIGDLDKKVVNYLLDAFGPQLTQLEMYACKTLLSQLQMPQFKNLQKLWLRLSEPSDTLENLRFLESPLKLLKLDCDFNSPREPWNVDKLLRNLRHLPIELLDVVLSLCRRVNLAEACIDIEEYKNTSIKTLIIHIDEPHSADNQISFNFLQALTTLENLQLKFSGTPYPPTTTHHGKVPEVVKLNEYLFGDRGADLPYHSNVWEKVPSLKTITLTQAEKEIGFFVNSIKSTYIREKYERITAAKLS